MSDAEQTLASVKAVLDEAVQKYTELCGSQGVVSGWVMVVTHQQLDGDTMVNEYGWMASRGFPSHEIRGLVAELQEISAEWPPLDAPPAEEDDDA